MRPVPRAGGGSDRAGPCGPVLEADAGASLKENGASHDLASATRSGPHSVKVWRMVDSPKSTTRSVGGTQ